MVLIAASVVAVSLATGATDRSRELTPIHIVVVAPPGTMRAFVRDAFEEAQAIWRPLGVSIVWERAQDNAPTAGSLDRFDGRAPQPGVDLTVTFEQGPVRSPEGFATLGWIRFTSADTPEPHIHLSRANAEDLMGRTASFRDGPALFHDRLLSRALGRALAHELGHYLLKSRTHSAAGLMRAVRRSSEFFEPDRVGFALTPEERAWLANRLACAYAESR
jgi:hypothetical protein